MGAKTLAQDYLFLRVGVSTEHLINNNQEQLKEMTLRTVSTEHLINKIKEKPKKSQRKVKEISKKPSQSEYFS